MIDGLIRNDARDEVLAKYGKVDGEVHSEVHLLLRGHDKVRKL